MRLLGLISYDLKSISPWQSWPNSLGVYLAKLSEGLA